MRARNFTLESLLAILVLSSFTFAAQTLTGTVRNGTTGKPAAGDEVVLLKLGEGMEEAGRTKTDAKGNFSFTLDGAQSPHLVRAIHQEVTYHRMAPPGTTSVEIEVYDAAKRVEGISVVADVMRFQVEQGQLEIVRGFAVQNASNPPRTQMNDRSLEFYAPEGAQIVEGSATTQGGNSLKSMPVQEGEKNRYSFTFPLRPGMTQFEVAYQIPYTGIANIDPKTIYPLQHFVAMLPKGMVFSAAPGTGYQVMNDPNQPDATVQVASSTKTGQALAFKISGAGVFQTAGGGGAEGSPEGSNQASNPGAEAAQSNSRPGGGLGPPIDAPDPLQKYRWQILGGFAVLLIVGAIFVASRQQAANRAIRSRAFTIDDLDADHGLGEASPAGETAARGTPPSLRRSSSMLLEGLKEELFELEVERQRGDISQPEYEKAKAALDQTLERALKREAQKA